jgi:addiction module HigA family antidote
MARGLFATLVAGIRPLFQLPTGGGVDVSVEDHHGTCRPDFRPSHPGRIVKRNIDALDMTIEAFAAHIGTTRQTVHAIIAGRSAVGPEMAVRLARAFNTTPQFWLAMQANHVLWQLERDECLTQIRPIAKTAITRFRSRRT